MRSEVRAAAVCGSPDANRVMWISRKKGDADDVQAEGDRLGAMVLPHRPGSSSQETEAGGPEFKASLSYVTSSRTA